MRALPLALAAALAAAPAAAQPDYRGSLGLDVVAPGAALSLGAEAPKYRFGPAIDPTVRAILPLSAGGPSGLALGGRTVLRAADKPNQEFGEAGLATVPITAGAELMALGDWPALRASLGIQDTLDNGLQLRGDVTGRLGEAIGAGIRLAVATRL